METILVIVTFVSLAMAIGMGLLVAKLLREERRRSDARVAALLELAEEQPAAGPIRAESSVPRTAEPRQREHRAILPAAEHERARAAHTAPRAPREPLNAVIDDFEIRPAAASDGAPELFVKAERPSPWRRRLAIITPMAIVVGIGLFGATVRIDSPLAEEPPQQTAVNAGVRRIPPLELLSLRHSQQEGRFTVAGVVQNPRQGAAISRIAATVVAFGSDGTQVASGRAPLDFTTLAPGGESPFVIEVPVARTVTRYRIGFRGEGGQVIEHVDRRSSADALARK